MIKTKGRREKRERGKEMGKKEAEKKKKKSKKEKMMEVKKIAEEWEIWDKKEGVAKSKEEAKKLVFQRLHKWIHIFEKKVS